MLTAQLVEDKRNGKTITTHDPSVLFHYKSRLELKNYFSVKVLNPYQRLGNHMQFGISLDACIN